MTEQPAILGEVRSYEDLHTIMRARADELDITRETIDALTGLQSGYAAKLLSPRPIKRLGDLSIGLMLPVLGMKLVAIVDHEAVQKLASQRAPREVRNAMLSAALHFKISKRFLRRIGRKGGKARMAKMTPAHRRRVARTAAKARWQRPDQAPSDQTPPPAVTASTRPGKSRTRSI